MSNVTRNTPWRGLGSVSLDDMRAEFKRLGSPIEPHAAAIHKALGPDSALALAMMFHEKKYDTVTDIIPRSFNNPLAVAKPEGGSGQDRWERYDAYDDAMVAWRNRIRSTTYKNGVYAKTTSIEDLIADAYAPASENDVERYIEVVVDRLNAFPRTPGVDNMAPYAFGNVKKPEVVKVHITDINTAWDDLGPREIEGAVQHGAVGTYLGTIGYFKGDARNRALTDYIVGGPWDGENDGKIAEFIPEDSRASPWANGPANGLEGDGVAYLRVRGVNAVNRNLRSIERSDGGNVNAPFSPTETPKQWRSIVNLTAWIFDDAQVPWDSYPLNPKFGIVTYLHHFEIGTKECPFYWVRANVDAFHDDVRGVMKVGQTKGTVVPGPVPPGPIKPEVPYSASADQSFLRRMFGSLRRYDVHGNLYLGPDNKPRAYKFDKKGVISNAWLNRAIKEQTFPGADYWRDLDGKDGSFGLITFDNGWVLVNHGEKKGWRWAS